MEFLNNERDDERRDQSFRPPPAPIDSLVTTNTPQQVLTVHGNNAILNSTVDLMYAPFVGPANPFRTHGAVPGVRVAGMGRITESSINDYTFHEQFNSYERNGFAIDSTTNEVLGDYNAYLASQQRPVKSKPETQTSSKRKRSKIELEIGDDSLGPWAPLPKSDVAVQEQVNKIKSAAAQAASDKKSALKATEEDKERKEREDAEVAKKSNIHINQPEEEDAMWEKHSERKIGHLLPPRPQDSHIEQAKSTFHGESLVDYQGRSWMNPPPGVRSDGGDHESFLPKKCVKKYTGHTKGVQAIEFFPGTGHLLLSASLDGKCKLWDVYGDRNVKRTFMGHSEAVRSIHMSNDGSKFLSSGFDRLIRQWDIETGQAVSTFSNMKMGYQVKYYPKDNNLFLVAASDNRIYQWDSREGKVSQEYNYHLEPCNTVTFFDNGSKFVSTSDDKKILVWEFDIPVPIKYIAEPDMHSVPAVTLHPSGTHFAGQSLDNKIVVYQCGEKVKLARKKVFEGHNNTGYACQIGFCPRGNFIISGDGLGKLMVWDWGSTRVLRKIQAHDGGPCMGAVWSPLKPSMLATCGWDGCVKLWE